MADDFENKPVKRPPARIRRYIVVVGIMFVLVIVFIWPIMDNARPAMLRTQCSNTMRQLVIAMHHYAEDHGTLPPAIVYDEAGSPMHSWRALILPYLEPPDTGADYDFAQAWNSPHNLAVADRLDGTLFGCPATQKRTWWGGVIKPDQRVTHYVALTGTETVFPDNQGVAIDAIADGTSRTIAVVEFANSDIQLLEPRDLPASHFIGAITRLQFSPGARSSSGNLKCVLSRHPAGINIGLADASIHILSRNTHIDTIKALTTRSGNETEIDF